MNRRYVSSSNLVSVGYDATSRILEVEFHGGRIYRYYGVPKHLYLGLMQASSHGEFLDAFIKKGGFSYSRIV